MSEDIVRIVIEELEKTTVRDDSAVERFVFDEDVDKYKFTPTDLMHVDEDEALEGFDLFESDPSFLVDVSAETLARWRAARDAYASAQLEMSACYIARSNQYKEAEQARQEADRVRRAEENAARAAEEARLDEEFGPRVWRAISRERSSGYRGAPKRTVAVLHHLDCPSSSGGQTTSSHMRLADAVAWMLDGPRPGQPSRDWCGRCCKPIQEAYNEEKRKRYAQPHQLDEK